MSDNNTETNNLLKGILLALALKEEERTDKTKILKAGGLSPQEIIELIGISETTLRTRKYREKKKQRKSNKPSSGDKND